MNARENEFTKVLEDNDQAEQLEQAIAEEGKEWVRVADEWIRENPYLAMGVAVAVGCAVAALIRNRD